MKAGSPEVNDTRPMSERVAAAVGVEPIDATRARGEGGHGATDGNGLFGGQMVSRSLAACAHTAPPGSVPDSIHANLLRGGDPSAPVEFHVERVRDGRNLQHRDVRGFQGDQLIVHAAVVSSMPMDLLDWQLAPAPPAAPPDPAAPPPTAAPGAPRTTRVWASDLGWGLFEVAHPRSDDAEPPSHPLWLRATEELPDDAWLHGAVVAFWSDFGMNWSARATHHGLDDRPISSVSATHSLWIHRRTPIHEWHLLDVHTASLSGNQGFVQASLFHHSGTLVASISQGVFIRPPT